MGTATNLAAVAISVGGSTQRTGCSYSVPFASAAMPDNTPDLGPAFPTESDVDAVLYEFRGDTREAIRALLHDIAVLAGDFEASVSHGFVRGAVPKLVLTRRS